MNQVADPPCAPLVQPGDIAVIFIYLHIYIYISMESDPGPPNRAVWHTLPADASNDEQQGWDQACCVQRPIQITCRL